MSWKVKLAGCLIAVLLTAAVSTATTHKKKPYLPRNEMCGALPNPGGVVIADLNGDGNADLAVTYPNHGVVVVCEGDGEGGFSESWSARVDLQIDGIAAGVYGAERTPFLAVVNRRTEMITLLFRTTDGEFVRWFPDMPTGEGPVDVAIGYRDAEEREPFVVVVNRASNDLTVIAEEDARFVRRTFDMKKPGQPEPQPVAVSVSDLDGDGRRDDLAVVCFQYWCVATLFGEDDGGFERRFGDIRTGEQPIDLVSGHSGGSRHSFIAAASRKNGSLAFFVQYEDNKSGYIRAEEIRSRLNALCIDMTRTGDLGLALIGLVENKSTLLKVYLVDTETVAERVLEQRIRDDALHTVRMGCLSGTDRPFAVVAGSRLEIVPLFID